ncbi:MAG: serine/threonine-protein kinase PknH/PknJ, partial [Mycobacterium sp.]
SPGAVVAGYRIERVLGTGGMGAVYVAANPTLPRHDALKVLSADLSRDADFRARFTREADVAAALDHPNIVSVYNRGQTEHGELWIAMQFVDGTDADAALRAGTMTPWRAVHIVVEVAKALDYAHAHGVVHRDVKPANFLVSGPVGQAERALLGDFGIARALDDVGLTVTGSVMATVAYAAPEVLSGMPFDGRADIYSMGCTLFRLLTGKTPFPPTNGMAAVMMAHLQQAPPRVSDLVPSLPVALDGVIASAMAKDPAARFPSASALAEAARAALCDPGWSPTTPLQPVPSREVISYPSLDGPPPLWRQHDGGPRTAMAASSPQQVGTGHRRRWLIGVAAAAVLLVGGSLTAVTLTRHGNSAESATDAEAGLTAAPGQGSDSGSAQGPPATDVPPSALRSILLTAAQISGNATAGAVVLEQDNSTLFDDTDTADPAECVGAWSPAQQRAYAGSGWTGVAVQLLRGMYKQVSEDGIIQAVVAFPSQTKAVQSLQQQQKQWAACAGKPVTVTAAGQAAQTWEFGPPATFTGIVKLEARLRDDSTTCQHGMSVRANILIDIRRCGPPGGSSVLALINSTADKVPR